MNEIMENIPAMVPIPVFEGHRDEAVLSVLDHNSVLYLNYNLPSMYQSEWRFLFSNSVYGDSFSQLVAHITNKGPNLLVVRDKKGHLFGGVAADNWECRPKFYGNINITIFVHFMDVIFDMHLQMHTFIYVCDDRLLVSKSYFSSLISNCCYSVSSLT